MARYNQEEDVRNVMKSLKEKLRREYDRDPTITVGSAVREIWEDLDVALVGADPAYCTRRTGVMQTAIEKLGLEYILGQRASKYLRI